MTTTAALTAATETVRYSLQLSALQWEAAADGADADGHDREPVELAAEQADELWRAALSCLEDGDCDAALTALGQVRCLEGHWGADDLARAAIREVEAAARA